jgi:hypothetical protein
MGSISIEAFLFIRAFRQPLVLKSVVQSTDPYTCAFWFSFVRRINNFLFLTSLPMQNTEFQSKVHFQILKKDTTHYGIAYLYGFFIF